MNKKTYAKAAVSAAPEIQIEPVKTKLTDMDKLNELYAKRDKLMKRKAFFKEQEKALDKRIADINIQIKTLEREMLFDFCRENDLTVDDIIDIVRKNMEEAE